VEAAAAGPALPRRPEVYLDLACPFSYLAAEQVERALGEVEWIAACVSAPGPAWLRGATRARASFRARAERAARALRLPLTWPDCSAGGFPTALRMAACAAESGAGGAFALAAMRLAFAGGYDLEDPEILAEAAMAAGLDPRGLLAAARRRDADGVLEDVARHLAAHGVEGLPAVRMGERWFCGEQAVGEAAAYRRGAAAMPA